MKHLTTLPINIVFEADKPVYYAMSRAEANGFCRARNRLRDITGRPEPRIVEGEATVRMKKRRKVAG